MKLLTEDTGVRKLEEGNKDRRSKDAVNILENCDVYMKFTVIQVKNSTIEVDAVYSKVERN